MLRPCLGRLWLLCALTVLQSLLQVGMALLTRFVIDAALTGGNLVFWGAMLAADLLLMILGHALLTWMTGSIIDKSTARLRYLLLRSAVFSRDVRNQGFHSGQLLSRGMEDVNIICDGVVNALPTLLGQVTRLVGAFAAVWLVSPPVAAVMALAAVLIGAAATAARPGLKRMHALVRSKDEKVMSTMQEDLQKLELIQSMDAQKPILGRFQGDLDISLRAKRRRRKWTVGVSGVINATTMAGSGGLLLWGAAQVAAGALTYGSLTSMIQLLNLFRGPVLGLSGMWTKLTSVEVAAQRLRNLIDTDIPPAPAQEKLEVKAVVFEDVTFGYPGEDAPVLAHFSARFPLEPWACLTGISGKGKTTLFKLIMGLHEPQSGTIWLETNQGRKPCGESTRHLFAYVPQDYALFSGTVRENLTLVAEENEDAFRQALAVAQADFAEDLDTVLGENNTGLSKGQLQRLAIARAILMERPIFLLDECTSALDAQTEAAVLKGLQTLGKQAILVTHRPEALTDLTGITNVVMDK